MSGFQTYDKFTMGVKQKWDKNKGVVKCTPTVVKFTPNYCLYSGFIWSTTGRIAGVGTRFGIFELLTAFYKDGREDNYVYVSEALLAGMAGGALEGFVTTPFELLKLRAQVTSACPLPKSSASITSSPVAVKLLRGYAPEKRAWDLTLGLLSNLSTSSAKNPAASVVVASLKENPWMLTGSGKPPPVHQVRKPSDIVSLEGWRGLWKGLRSGIARDTIFGGIFFSTWQFLHISMLNLKSLDMNPPPTSIEDIGPLSPWATSVAAGLSGSVAAAGSHCFDTAQSRSQCIVLPKYVSMERRLLKWRKPGYWIERISGINPADRNLLFRGIGLRMARSGLASFAIVGTYFLAVDHLI
ncbi:hypothetical protein ACHQM5_017084 [Ranunculus cassubicifolius]